MKNMILQELFNVVLKLENFNVLEVSSQIVSEVANIIVATTKMSIKVQWINKVR